MTASKFELSVGSGVTLITKATLSELAQLLSEDYPSFMNVCEVLAGGQSVRDQVVDVTFNHPAHNPDEVSIEFVVEPVAIITPSTATNTAILNEKEKKSGINNTDSSTSIAWNMSPIRFISKHSGSAKSTLSIAGSLKFPQFFGDSQEFIFANTELGGGSDARNYCDPSQLTIGFSVANNKEFLLEHANARFSNMCGILILDRAASSSGQSSSRVDSVVFYSTLWLSREVSAPCTLTPVPNTEALRLRSFFGSISFNQFKSIVDNAAPNMSSSFSECVSTDFGVIHSEIDVVIPTNNSEYVTVPPSQQQQQSQQEELSTSSYSTTHTGGGGMTDIVELQKTGFSYKCKSDLKLRGQCCWNGGLLPVNIAIRDHRVEIVSSSSPINGVHVGGGVVLHNAHFNVTFQCVPLPSKPKRQTVLVSQQQQLENTSLFNSKGAPGTAKGGPAFSLLRSGSDCGSADGGFVSPAMDSLAPPPPSHKQHSSNTDGDLSSTAMLYEKPPVGYGSTAIATFTGTLNGGNISSSSSSSTARVTIVIHPTCPSEITIDFNAPCSQQASSATLLKIKGSSIGSGSRITGWNVTESNGFEQLVAQVNASLQNNNETAGGGNRKSSGALVVNDIFPQHKLHGGTSNVCQCAFVGSFNGVPFTTNIPLQMAPNNGTNNNTDAQQQQSSSATCGGLLEEIIRIVEGDNCVAVLKCIQ